MGDISLSLSIFQKNMFLFFQLTYAQNRVLFIFKDILLKNKDLIYLILERGMEGERGREASMYGCLSSAPH